MVRTNRNIQFWPNGAVAVRGAQQKRVQSATRRHIWEPVLEIIPRHDAQADRCKRAHPMNQRHVFERLKWTGELWTTTLSIPYFRASGERIHLTDADEQELPPRGEVELKGDTDEVRRPPSDLQRVAMQAMLRRGDAIWDGAMDVLCDEYRHQRSNRVRYWKVLQGLG